MASPAKVQRLRAGFIAVTIIPPKRTLASLALLTLVLAGCATEGTCKMGRATDLPLRMARHHLVSAVEINGQPADMILGTGAFGTLLTHEAVTRLHLPTPEWTNAEARASAARAASLCCRRRSSSSAGCTAAICISACSTARKCSAHRRWMGCSAWI
jgi:hypothetical protein